MKIKHLPSVPPEKIQIEILKQRINGNSQQIARLTSEKYEAIEKLNRLLMNK